MIQKRGIKGQTQDKIPAASTIASRKNAILARISVVEGAVLFDGKTAIVECQLRHLMFAAK